MQLGKREARLRRKKRIRRRVGGTGERPRLTVYRSNKHIYAQVIDDSSGRTLVGASTMGRGAADVLRDKTKAAKAEVVGQELARRCLEKGISKVVFDRNGYVYHGRVKALAEGARKVGLSF